MEMELDTKVKVEEDSDVEFESTETMELCDVASTAEGDINIVDIQSFLPGLVLVRPFKDKQKTNADRKLKTIIDDQLISPLKIMDQNRIRVSESARDGEIGSTHTVARHDDNIEPPSDIEHVNDFQLDQHSLVNEDFEDVVVANREGGHDTTTKDQQVIENDHGKESESKDARLQNSLNTIAARIAIQNLVEEMKKKANEDISRPKFDFKTELLEIPKKMAAAVSNYKIEVPHTIDQEWFKAQNLQNFNLCKEVNDICRELVSGDHRQVWRCWICSETCLSISGFNAHNKLKHYPGEMDCCDLCNAKFSAPSLLRQHQTRNHKQVAVKKRKSAETNTNKETEKRTQKASKRRPN